MLFVPCANILESGFCRMRACMRVGLRVKPSEPKDCQMKSSSSSPPAKMSSSQEKDLLWFSGVSFDVDGSLFLEEREPNQKHRASNVWIHCGVLWLSVAKGAAPVHSYSASITNIGFPFPAVLYFCFTRCSASPVHWCHNTYRISQRPKDRY